MLCWVPPASGHEWIPAQRLRATPGSSLPSAASLSFARVLAHKWAAGARSRAGAHEAGSWGAGGPLGSLRAANRDLQSSSQLPGCRADPCHCSASECPTTALGCQVRTTDLGPGCLAPSLASRDALASSLHPPMTCLLKPFTVLRLVHLQASPGSGCSLNHTTFSSCYLG